MFTRVCLTPPPPTDADLDTPEMAETAVAVERGERHLRILARLTDIAMTLAEALGREAEARIEARVAAASGDDAGAPVAAGDPAAAFNKIAQTVRRTIALEAKLAEGLKPRRDDLATKRASRREDRDAAHRQAVENAVEIGLIDACEASVSEIDYENLDALLVDADEYLTDADEFRDYLARPVGETVARLCALLNLDPDSCVEDDDGTWTVRRGPRPLERRMAEMSGRSAVSARPAPAPAPAPA